MLTRRTVRAVLRLTALALLPAACATTPGVTGPSTGDFRLVRAMVTTAANVEMLEVTAELTNTGTTLLRSGGCLRPDLAIDVQAGSGWDALDVVQTSELAVCIQAFTLAPGGTQQFTTAFRRVIAADAFPRSVPIRLRVLLQPSGSGPTLPLTIR